MKKQDFHTDTVGDLFPDRYAAQVYLEGRRWGTGVSCPACKKVDRITARRDGFYRCNLCKLDFTVRTGTILERSHIPLNKWLQAMHLLATSGERISSVQLSRDIGITQKSAWLMLQRLCEACGNDLLKKLGIEA